MMRKLKQKWNIKSNFHLFVIFFVFAITGTLALWVAKPLLSLLNIEQELLPAWVFWPLRIFVIFPIYQILIVFIGALFGQFKFFWEFEKKILLRLGFKKFKEN